MSSRIRCNSKESSRVGVVHKLHEKKEFTVVIANLPDTLLTSSLPCGLCSLQINSYSHLKVNNKKEMNGFFPHRRSVKHTKSIYVYRLKSHRECQRVSSSCLKRSIIPGNVSLVATVFSDLLLCPLVMTI